jgi:hypothetical protein
MKNLIYHTISLSPRSCYYFSQEQLRKFIVQLGLIFGPPKFLGYPQLAMRQAKTESWLGIPEAHKDHGNIF